jgi:predicted metal-dependent TIM-barrel fold hydrolase
MKNVANPAVPPDLHACCANERVNVSCAQRIRSSVVNFHEEVNLNLHICFGADPRKVPPHEVIKRQRHQVIHMIKESHVITGYSGIEKRDPTREDNVNIVQESLSDASSTGCIDQQREIRIAMPV